MGRDDMRGRGASAIAVVMRWESADSMAEAHHSFRPPFLGGSLKN
jgi:hypothetical protein